MFLRPTNPALSDDDLLAGGDGRLFLAIDLGDSSRRLDDGDPLNLLPSCQLEKRIPVRMRVAESVVRKDVQIRKHRGNCTDDERAV